jgi:hypothetical protein
MHLFAAKPAVAGKKALISIEGKKGLYVALFFSFLRVDEFAYATNTKRNVL